MPQSKRIFRCPIETRMQLRPTSWPAPSGVMRIVSSLLISAKEPISFYLSIKSTLYIIMVSFFHSHVKQLMIAMAISFYFVWMSNLKCSVNHSKLTCPVTVVMEIMDKLSIIMKLCYWLVYWIWFGYNLPVPVMFFSANFQLTKLHQATQKQLEI
jgi:hypothetical protein